MKLSKEQQEKVDDFNIDTSKGQYFASNNKHVLKKYKPFHNELIDALQKSLVAIFDDAENFVGSGGLFEYSHNGTIFKLLVTTEHVMRNIKKLSGKIKIPINHSLVDKENWAEQSMCISFYLNENNHIENKQFDIGIAYILSEDNALPKLSEHGYVYINIGDICNAEKLVNYEALIFGLLDSRIKKATRKNKEIGTGFVAPYGFQHITEICKVEPPFFYIKYPYSIYFVKPNNILSESKGKSPDPSGLSGSIVWDYSKNTATPLGMIIERSGETIKCIDFNKIMDLFKEKVLLHKS